MVRHLPRMGANTSPSPPANYLRFPRPCRRPRRAITITPSISSTRLCVPLVFVSVLRGAVVAPDIGLLESPSHVGRPEPLIFVGRAARPVRCDVTVEGAEEPEILGAALPAVRT